jgi:hypothetical protein
MIFSRLELPRRKLMESLSLTRNAEIVGSLFMDIRTVPLMAQLLNRSCTLYVLAH